jgi:hypothetical protein
LYERGWVWAQRIEPPPPGWYRESSDGASECRKIGVDRIVIAPDGSEGQTEESEE